MAYKPFWLEARIGYQGRDTRFPLSSLLPLPPKQPRHPAADHERDQPQGDETPVEAEVGDQEPSDEGAEHAAEGTASADQSEGDALAAVVRELQSQGGGADVGQAEAGGHQA